MLAMTVLCSWTIISACVVGWQFYRHRELESIPSLGWLLLVTVPFAVQWGTFATGTRGLHLFGVVLTGACLLMGDVLLVAPGASAGEGRSPSVDMFGRPILYVVFFAFIAGLHLILMDRIPLWGKYIHGIRDETVLQVMRENASKLLNVPDLLKYVFNWTVIIVVPVGVGLFINGRRYLFAAVFVIGALFYANITLAKFPTLIMVSTIAMIVLGELSLTARKRFFAAAGLLGLLSVAYAVPFFLNTSENVFRYEPSQDRVASMHLKADDPRRSLTFGDKSRLKPRKSRLESTFTEGPLDYIVYRTFLGPTDVSSRWYQYFPEYSGGFIGWEGIAPGTRGPVFVHPAKRVGKWAYTERFPEWYLESIHAYASVDADAYARFGMAGIIAAGLLVFAVRAGLKLLLIDAPLMRSLYAVALVMLALLLPMASLQALLLANGLAIVIMLMLVYRWILSRRSLPTVA